MAVLAAALLVPAAANATFRAEDIAASLAYASCGRLFLEGAAAQLNARGLAPSADRIVDRIDRVPAADLLAAFRAALARILEDARRTGALPGTATAAIDMHRIPRYRRAEEAYKGRRRARDLPMAVAGKNVAGTNLGHQFATIEVVGVRDRLTLEVVPWFHGSTYREVIAALLAAAQRWVRVGLLLMDREFFNAESVRAAIDAGVPFLVPARKDPPVKGAIERCRGLTHLVEPYPMGDRVVNLVVVDREAIGRGEGHWTFATDLPADRWRELSRLYADRWGIETGYREKKAFRARTCSLSYGVRLALFLTSVLATSVWTMERERGPVAWRDRTPAHLVRFALALHVLVTFEPRLLEEALALAEAAA